MKMKRFTPLIILGCTAAFTVDATVSSGSSFGVLYIPILFLRLTMERPPSIYILLGVVFILNGLGFILPSMSTNLAEALFDRIMTVVSAVFTAVLIEEKIKSRKLNIERMISDERMKIKADNIEKELMIARALQESILPKVFPATPSVSGYGIMVPAREVGGDFFDFITIDAHHIGIAIGDVTGKGVPAAFFMAIVRTLLRTIALLKLPPAECLARLNDQIAAENDQEMFVTIFYGILDKRTGEFTYSNGGHNQPALLTRKGDVTFLPETGGVLIGMIGGLNYNQCTIRLSRGDCVFLYTDGVVEAFNSSQEQFSEKNLISALRLSSNLPTNKLVHAVLNSVKSFECGVPQSDDITCVCLRYLWES
ncbi:MAG: PP2C family protein-serine/threonine phosphatase [Rhodospirillaceae bacterium]